MNRSLRKLAVVGSAAVLMLVVAPAAQAGPQDAPGCTTVYVSSLTHSSAPQFVEYTPPANVGVNGNAVLGYVGYVAGATKAYVDCVV